MTCAADGTKAHQKYTPMRRWMRAIRELMLNIRWYAERDLDRLCNSGSRLNWIGRDLTHSSFMAGIDHQRRLPAHSK